MDARARHDAGAARQQRARQALRARRRLRDGRRAMVRRAALGDLMRTARALIFVSVALATTLAAAAACAEVAVVDDAGARVTLAAPARRIVSLAPHATELLFAAGAGAQVVGVVAGSNFPPQAERLPSVGDVNAIDLERLVALAPDLVVTWPYTTSAQLAAIRRLDIAVDLGRLGVLAGTTPVEARAARAFRDAISAAHTRPAKKGEGSVARVAT